MSGIGNLGSLGNELGDEGNILFRLQDLFVTHDDNTDDVVDLSANDTSQKDDPAEQYWNH